MNGVDKPDEQLVIASADDLRSRLDSLGVTCIANVTHLWNPSSNLLDDVFREVVLQKVSELRISFAEAMLAVVGAYYSYSPLGLPAQLLLSEADSTALRNRAIAFMQDASLSSYSFTSGGKAYTTASLVNEFRDRVIVDLGRGTKVVLVAHSQGNLFANETLVAVRGTAPPSVYRGLAVVNVANAASSAPSGLYITSSQDLVIDGLRLIAGLAQPMLPNESAGFSSADRSGHGFKEIYISTTLPDGSSIQNTMAGKVCSLVQRALNETQDPAGFIIGSTFSSLIRIDLDTLTAQTLGSFTTTSGGLTPVHDFAINPRGGLAVAISPSALSSFDPGIRQLTRLPSSGTGGNALTFNVDGELFAMSGNSFYKLDPVSGAIVGNATPLGVGYTTSGDLTFDSDGNLFGTAIGPNGRDHLIKIDPLKNTVTPIGDIGYYGVWGLYFSRGVLYGAASDGTLISINRATGQGAFVAILNISGISGLQ